LGAYVLWADVLYKGAIFMQVCSANYGVI
jgi:hypothetical protein